MLNENPYSVETDDEWGPPEIQPVKSKRLALRPIPVIEFPPNIFCLSFVTEAVRQG